MTPPRDTAPDWFTTAFGAHYLALYSHRDEDEARACVAVLDALRPLAPGPLLDLGCGAGRHLPFLAERGAAGLGLDLSAPLLADAVRRRDGPAAVFPLVRGDMRRLPLGDATVSGVLSLFTAFGYFGRLAAHRDMVGEIARVLRPGGHWYLDYLNPSLVRAELAGRSDARRRDVGPCRVDETRSLSGDGATVRKQVRLSPLPGRETEAAAAGVPASGLAYTESVALFSVAELQVLAADHGLDLAASAGGYGGEPFVEAESPRWILVFRRREG